MGKIILLAPAYDEAENLAALVEKADAAFRAAGYDYAVVVVNDGSRDETAAVLADLSSRFRIEVVTHRRNRGLGESIRDGLERAVEISDPDDVIVRIDGDNTHEPQYVATMIERLAQGYDIVIASRFQPGGTQLGVSLYRRMLSRFANLFMKCFFPMRNVRDFSCGYRAYRVAVVQHCVETFGKNFIQLGGLGFACTLEKLVKMHLLGARISEIAFTHRYDLKLGQSKMAANLTTLGYLIMMLMHYWPFGGWRRSYRALRRVPTTTTDGLPIARPRTSTVEPTRTRAA